MKTTGIRRLTVMEGDKFLCIVTESELSSLYEACCRRVSRKAIIDEQEKKGK